MRCLVTGVAGFVGSSLAEQLIAEGHSVIGIDCFTDYYDLTLKERNLSALMEESAFTFHKADLLEIDLQMLLEGVEWVFHQAAQAGVRASWGEYFRTYTNNNVLATQHLLEACRDSDTVKKIVYASSSSIYGNAECFPTPEDVIPQPVSPYGVTKLAAEHLMNLYHSEFALPTASLRYFTVFGPRQRPDMAFHKFIRATLLGEEISLYGDGEQSRDFTFIDDIVRANILAAEKAPGGAVYNIGGGARTTVNEVLRFLEGQLGEIRINRYEARKGDARHTSAETSRAAAELGYAPQVPLFDGLQKEIAWLRELLGV